MVYLLQHAIDRSAERYPDSEAFRCWGEGITYAALVRRANQLAHVLRERGVGRRDRVGIFRPKGLESAIAINGIWKAGAAYVPLDPTAPAQRVAWMMRDCGIRHVITDESKRDALAAIAAEVDGPLTFIGVAPGDDLAAATCLTWDDVATAPDAAPVIDTVEDDLAYIMYTSGSTGRPKGMMHTHRSGLAYARMSGALYGVRPDDILSNHAPLHFDISTFEYFTGPLHGATSVLIPEMYMLMPASLSQLMEQERVTFWYSVPYALIQLELRGVLDERDLTSLRYVMYGGEPFPPKYLRALQQRWPHAEFHNVYGPAEVNQCSYYPVPPLPEGHEEPIPIGTMCPNYDGLILDGDDTPIDDDRVGELVVRTPSMMRGYWNRPDLNAKVFYRRTLLPEFDAVYLRTGDLVRRRPDGLLDFLGRKDRQIKVRGYRVELDEVENAFAAHPAVQEAAAYPVRRGETTTIEAALLLRPNRADGVSAATLTDFATERLPHYAVPARVALHTTLPRTTSGKIDRRALQQAAEQTLG